MASIPEEEYPFTGFARFRCCEESRKDEKPAGAIDIDATQPLDQVVEELLHLASV